MSAHPASKIVSDECVSTPVHSAEQLYNALPNPVLVLGENDQIVDVNAACEHFFHASAAALKRYKDSFSYRALRRIPETGSHDRPIRRSPALAGRI